MQLFFLLECAAVAIVLLFFYLRLSKKESSNFRDDIWKNKPKDPAARAAFEDQVDKKILLEHRPDPLEEPEPTDKIHTAGKADKTDKIERPPFRLPNFRGKAHEVLGISADADVELIGKAHKYWIKRYHPDRVTHLGAGYVEQARRRAEQLNTARQEMLKIAASRR